MHSHNLHSHVVGHVHDNDDNNRLIVGLGVGNTLSALFGGIGGCGLIPNTVLNSSEGGYGYASEVS